MCLICLIWQENCQLGLNFGKTQMVPKLHCYGMFQEKVT